MSVRVCPKRCFVFGVLAIMGMYDSPIKQFKIHFHVWYYAVFITLSRNRIRTTELIPVQHVYSLYDILCEFSASNAVPRYA